METNKVFAVIIITFLFINASCGKSSDNNTGGGTGGGGTTPVVSKYMDSWITTGDQTSLLQKQSTQIPFASSTNSYSFIDVDSITAYQSIDGFGYTLTSGSATLINALSAATKASLLQELFGTGSNSIGVSYLRMSIGASDLSASVYSCDDVANDTTLANFSLAKDEVDLIPLLKQIVAINPNIKIIATPWSAPAWMKDNASSIAGSLQTKYYNIYAKYFVKFIQQIKADGITIDAITPQNEPLNAGNNPSMLMTAPQETEFIKTNLGPAFQAAGLTTKIICYDHNCDQTVYPITVLSDAAAAAFINGSAFHLYAGDINALTSVHIAYPTKQLYFTEQYTASTGNFGGDLQWHLKNVIIGSMRNWCRNALEWNLANDASFGPHTTGGCTTCQGALTINGQTITRNVAYYIIAHASEFVPAGSVRITSNINAGIQNVAFLRADGKKVLIAENDNSTAVTFNIRFNGSWVTTALAAGAVGTYVW